MAGVGASSSVDEDGVEVVFVVNAVVDERG